MVLWEITLGTAYFLGLKRTYRLALRIKRRLISPKHPRIRQFLRRRTRFAFDAALKGHQKIQQMDIEVGRNLGNWILRWLDRWNPAAEIRGPSLGKPSSIANSSMNMIKKVTNSSQLKNFGSMHTWRNHYSCRRLLISYKNMWPKPFPTIRMMIPLPMPAGSMNQYRQLSINGPEAFRSNFSRGGYVGVIRKDIMQWMLQN